MLSRRLLIVFFYLKKYLKKSFSEYPQSVKQLSRSGQTTLADRVLDINQLQLAFIAERSDEH